MTNKLRPFDFGDWLTIIVVVFLFVFAMLTSGCRSAADIQGKRDLKDQREAEALIAEAITKWPGILHTEVRVDTVTVYTEPAFGVGKRSYSQASMDSLATICSRLVSSYRDRSVSAEKARGNAEKALRQLRNTSCLFDTITVIDGPLEFKVWQDVEGVDWIYHNAAQKVEVPVETAVRTVRTEPQKEPCPPQGRVKSWGWAGAVWGLIAGLVIGFVACLFLMGSFRQ